MNILGEIIWNRENRKSLRLKSAWSVKDREKFSLARAHEVGGKYYGHCLAEQVGKGEF